MYQESTTGKEVGGGAGGYAHETVDAARTVANDLDRRSRSGFLAHLHIRMNMKRLLVWCTS